MSRADITAQIGAARLAKGLTWKQIADAIDKPVVWTISGLLGEHPIPVESGRVLVDLLGLDESAVPVLAAVPMRGYRVRCRPTRRSTVFTRHFRSTAAAIKEDPRGVRRRNHECHQLQSRCSTKGSS